MPLEGARRRRAGTTPDRIEGEGDDFLERVQAGFRALAAASPGRWKVVDASGGVEEVAAAVRAAVE